MHTRAHEHTRTHHTIEVIPGVSNSGTLDKLTLQIVLNMLFSI